MSVRAVLRFAPVFNPRMVEDASLSRALVVQRGGLETLGRDEAVPVLVDHDEERRVGDVIETYTCLHTDGLEWYFARCELWDVPGWLRRDGGVSWSYHSLQEQDVNGSTRLLRGVIREVSVLSPSVQPAEGRAAVAWIGESSAAGSSSDRAAAGDVIPGDGRTITRHGIGQVLGVR